MRSTDAPRRRNRTRQRERLLEVLRTSDRHPTAAELHEQLMAEFPRLSLGTIYRNLEVLLSRGAIEVVPSAEGPARYDGNTRPHHHFTCERCGSIQDLDLSVPPSLARRVREEHALSVHRVRIDFTGLCRSCDEAPNPVHD